MDWLVQYLVRAGSSPLSAGLGSAKIERETLATIWNASVDCQLLTFAVGNLRHGQNRNYISYGIDAIRDRPFSLFSAMNKQFELSIPPSAV